MASDDRTSGAARSCPLFLKLAAGQERTGPRPRVGRWCLRHSLHRAAMNALLRDIRYGFRSLRHSPALAAVATLALTIGIALTTTMFSILYGALMKGLPFEDGKRIVMVQRANPTNGSSRMTVTMHDYADYVA